LAKPQFPVTPTESKNQRPQQTSNHEFEAVKMQATKRNYDSREEYEKWVYECVYVKMPAYASKAN